MKNAVGSLCLFVAFLPLPIAAEVPSEDLVLRTQFLLMEAGINPGPLDGKLGGKTKEAIRLYETQHNLPLTGQPTHDLISKLRELLTVWKPAEKQSTNREAVENEQSQEEKEELTGSDLAIAAARDAVNHMATFYTIAGSIMVVIVAALGVYGIKDHRDLNKQAKYLIEKMQDTEEEHKSSLVRSSRRRLAFQCEDTINVYDALYVATDKGTKAPPTIRKKMDKLLSRVHNIAAEGTSAAIQPEDNYLIALFLLYRANALKRSGSIMPALQLAEEASKLPGISDTLLAGAYFSAGCYASLNDNNDLCFTYLKMALSKNPDLLRDIETDNDLDKIRSDPRYTALGATVQTSP